MSAIGGKRTWSRHLPMSANDQSGHCQFSLRSLTDFPEPHGLGCVECVGIPLDNALVRIVAGSTVFCEVAINAISQWVKKET
jgi:hypothetical protein